MLGVVVVALLAGPGAAAAWQKQLAIVEARLHQYEDGPPLTASHTFLHGDPVFVSFRIAGFQKTDTDTPHVVLTWRVDVFDPAGIPLAETKSDKIDVDLAPQDKNWLPKIRHDFMIPSLCEPGRHRVVIHAQDGLNRATATHELAFNVSAPEVEPSETLVARNFRFLRSEQDGAGPPEGVYRPGDTVWARFEMTGYRLGPGNEYDVAYGLEVFRDSDGQRMYAEPNAARETDRSFYRKRYLPGVLSLKLTPDIARGKYTIHLTLRDQNGKHEARSSHRFTIE